ncbi:MAG: hypothetical protein H6934_06400 [Burkholderiaceae bacterium]|nr:hypothetical protein [Burkholderiaceae bacterium]
MNISAETLLMLAVAGLYLYDSAQLLYCNEAVLIPAGKRDWKAGFGSANFSVLGRELYVPNLLLIHRPLFRLSWSFERSGGPSEPWEPAHGAFLPLAPLVWNIAIALFVLLPLGFFTYLGDFALLPALLLLYANMLLALGWIWFHRRNFQLSGKGFASLAFECLICPPFALNLVRRVGLGMPVREDLVSAARRLQREADWAQTRDRLIARLANEIESEDPKSKRYALLQARRRVLVDEGESCPA